MEDQPHAAASIAGFAPGMPPTHTERKQMIVANPWMLVTGCVIVGWLAPEIFAAILKRGIPVMLNILGAIAGGLIAGAFVA